MARPERSARLLLGFLLLALGLWPFIVGTRSSLPLPASTYLLQAISSGTLVALGLVVLFLGRILKILGPAKEKTTE